MADEQEPIAEVEAETPIEPDEEQPVNLDAPEQEPEVEDTAEDEGEEPAEPEEELEEFDWNGKQVKGPKGLKDGLMMQADYTRKTQEVAATKRELEQRAAALDQQFKAADEELDLRANLKAIDAEIQQYANVDWQKLNSDDLVGAQSHWLRYQQLKEAAQAAASELNTKAHARTEKTQQETAKRLQETREFAEKSIPGWTPEIDAKVTDLLRSKGLTDDFIVSAYTPQVYELAWLAHIGFQTLQKPAAKPAPKPAPQPLTVVASKANPSARKALADMSMEEYAAARKAGRGG